jgi:hypothetical protein
LWLILAHFTINERKFCSKDQAFSDLWNNKAFTH